MTETTAAATKAKNAKHIASPFGLSDYGIPQFEIPKFDLPIWRCRRHFVR